MKNQYGYAAVLMGVCGAAMASPNPVTNIRNSYPYPVYDYCFQDHRSIQDIFAGRLPREIANAGDPDDLGPGMACFDPINPPTPEMMAEVQRYIEGGYSSRYQASTRWARGTMADPISLTWSFVPDGLVVGDGGPGGAGASTLFSTMDSRFASSGGRATWVLQIQNVFNRWQALTGITYTRVRNAANNDWDDGAAWGTLGGTNRGDVRISMKNIDNVNGILAYNSYPDNGDMVIDSSENWASSGNTYRFLRDVVMHEHGHGLGLAHVCPQGTASAGSSKLMAPFVDTTFDGPQQDDIRAQSFYGDPYEPNDTSSTAYDMGSIAAGATLNMGVVPSPTPANAALLSIERNGELDYYAFTIDAPRLVNFTVTPIGSNYNENPQATDGSCPNDNTFSNGLASADLAFDVRNSAGTIIYRSVNATAIGLAESTTGLLVSPAGTHALRVFESGSQTEVQSYRFSMTVQNVNLAPTASDGTFNDFVRVTWPSTITDADGYQVVRNSTDTTTNASVVGTVGTGVFTFDDTSAIPGVTYFYFVKARQPGNTGYRYMTASGNSGFRPITNTAPTANAGPDQTVTDEDRTGSEPVLLNGSASTDAQGPIANYRWAEGAATLANGASPTASIAFDVGVHTVTLTVTDSGGLTGTDTAIITVNPGCFADYNLDGGVDGSDISAFFTDWELGNAAADANADGGVDGGDIEAFFAVWANGGC